MKNLTADMILTENFHSGGFHLSSRISFNKLSTTNCDMLLTVGSFYGINCLIYYMIKISQYNSNYFNVNLMLKR